MNLDCLPEAGFVKHSDVRHFDDSQSVGRQITPSRRANRKIFRRFFGIWSLFRNHEPRPFVSNDVVWQRLRAYTVRRGGCWGLRADS